jgi:uncharacterized repeat protein (TIGR03803 family)
MRTSTWKSILGRLEPELAGLLGRANADPLGASEPGRPADSFTASLNLAGASGDIAALPAASATPRLKLLADFTGDNGALPYGGLVADAAGDLFGTTYNGGAHEVGTVFEIAKTGNGYASTPTTLISFDTANGEHPMAALIIDAAGDLFGTTVSGGANNAGTVFELANTGTGYADAPTTLVSFSSTGSGGRYPYDRLMADASGNLFGTTSFGGVYDHGAVFEIAKVAGGYAGTPTTIASFNGYNGSYPDAGLIADAAGDLFGATSDGGLNGYGAVFEIAKTGDGYASTPTTLASFARSDGYPSADLVADAAGNLFGVTTSGGTGGGTVFEIAKTPTGYAAATALVHFTRSDGADPNGALIIDAAGNLFGTTSQGGLHGAGTVFEIAKTESGYASAPTTVVDLTGGFGGHSWAGLIADAAGNLFGESLGGAAPKYGSVFEIFHSGFVVSPPPAAFAQAMAGQGAGGSGSAGPASLASRNEAPTLLSLPRAA